MGRTRLAVAALVLVSGCNAVFAGQSTPTETVTPAPVPSPDVTPRGTDAPEKCLVPPPVSRPGTPPPPPAETRPLPRRGGNVSGSDLVALHASVISEYRYHLRLGDGRGVWSLANHSAFAYAGPPEGANLLTAYAVGGTLYELDHTTDGPDVLRERPYRPESMPGRLPPRLTGSKWLDDAIGDYEYEIAGTRDWRGTRVRVLRWTVEEPTLVGFKYVFAANSTVLVDRRGIVRHVDHYEQFAWVHPERNPDDSNKSEFSVDKATARYTSYNVSVTQLGTAPIPRPDAFCGQDGDVVVRTATASASARTATP